MTSLESVVRAFAELHPQDAARALEAIGSDEAVRLLNRLPTKVAAPLLEGLNPTVAGPLLALLAGERACDLLSAMGPRAASIVLQQLTDDAREQVLSGLDEPRARAMRELAKYPPDSAGALMRPRVASLSADLTVQQAIARIQKTPRDVLYYLYVADREGKLIGLVTMRDLLLAAPRDRVESIVIGDPVSVPDTASREEVVQILRERRFLSVPVVDFDGRLIGVVRRQDVVELGETEAFKDLQKIVGAGADERALSPVSTVVKSRLPWLYVNLVTAFMAAAVVGLFEGIIAQMAALAVLLPVVAGQGGNTGSQALAVMMRGLALREIVPGVRKRVIMKELMGGLINSVGVAVVTAVCVLGWRLSAGDTVGPSSGLALVIGLSMVVNMAAAALSGAVIPLVLKSLGRDPAQSSAIFLTTVTDIVGFGSFLGFAVLFKPLLL